MSPRGFSRGSTAYPMGYGYVAGYVTCYGTGYVTKTYLVFNFATVIPRISVAMTNLFVPAKIAKTREPSFVKIQARKIFGSIAEVQKNFQRVWLW